MQVRLEATGKPSGSKPTELAVNSAAVWSRLQRPEQRTYKSTMQGQGILSQLPCNDVHRLVQNASPCSLGRTESGWSVDAQRRPGCGLLSPCVAMARPQCTAPRKVTMEPPYTSCICAR